MINGQRLLWLQAIVALLPVATAGSAWGQCGAVKLLPSDGVAEERFGRSIAINGDVLVVGVPLDDDLGANSGSAYIFRFDGFRWLEEAKVLASDGATSDQFGQSVAINGDVLLVGAPYDDDNGTDSGSAYLFRFDGLAWSEEAKLTPLDIDGNDKFGTSVDASAQLIVVGAPFAASNGAAYVYRSEGLEWVQEFKLISNNFDNNGPGFGHAVSIDGDLILVGAPFDDVVKFVFNAAGSAFVFHRNVNRTWTEEQKITLPTPGNDDQFGRSLEISGDLALIGAYSDDDVGANAGPAHAYERLAPGMWVKEATLTASDTAPNDLFAWSVGISGAFAIVGAYKADGAGLDSGAAYVFERTAGIWTQISKLTAFDANFDDNFGTSVAISTSAAAVGAPQDDDLGNSSGSVYPYPMPILDCNENGQPDVCDISDGTSSDCNGDGVPDECAPDCNANGVGDDCDIGTGSSLDCNENGIPDECDVASGFSQDCDGDEVPDDCQTLYFVDTSPPLGPVGDGFPQTHVIIAPPEPSPQPATTVLISLAAQGDLSALTEWVDVFLNGQLIGTVFDLGANDCPGIPDEDSLTLDVDTFRTLVGSGDADFELVASFAVDSNLCAESFMTIQVEYQAVTEEDCNGNAVPDICDIFFGGSSDKNGDLIPDECQLCLEDVNADGAVNVLDLIDLLLCFGQPAIPGCVGEDINNDGTVNVLDLIELLLVFGTACP